MLELPSIILRVMIFISVRLQTIGSAFSQILLSDALPIFLLGIVLNIQFKRKILPSHVFHTDDGQNEIYIEPGFNFNIQGDKLRYMATMVITMAYVSVSIFISTLNLGVIGLGGIFVVFTLLATIMYVGLQIGKADLLRSMRTDRALYKHGFTDADPTADNSSPRNQVDSDA